jgi:hypothetical protein
MSVGYWTINGEPACRSSLQPRRHGCSCSPEDFEAAKAAVLEAHPDAVCEHFPGEHCPAYAEEQDADRERYDDEEDRHSGLTVRQLMALIGPNELLITSGHVLTSRVPRHSQPCLRCGATPFSAEGSLREPCEGPDLTAQMIRAFLDS